MGFKEAVRTTVREKYATFAGRAARSEYWYFMLFLYGVLLILTLPFLLFGGIGDFDSGNFSYGSGVLITLPVLFFLAMIIPSIAVTVRRFHDRDLSGWWVLLLMLLSYIPYVGFIASIVILVITILKGTEGENKFGRDPLSARNDAEVFA